jgi:peptidoglycan/LPS O-acetylase OafA/YrhL
MTIPLASKIAYTPALDGLRAVCILFTLFNHIGGAPAFVNGTVGVDIFFALSGFLITLMIADNTPADLPPYLIRRVFRIAPVYYLALIATVVLALVADRLHVGGSRIDQLNGMLIPSILFSRELSASPTLFGQAWTVGIEEKFYLVWPIFLLVFRRDMFRLIAAFAIIILLLVVNNAAFARGYGGIAFGAISALAYRRGKFSINPYVALAIITCAYVVTLLSHHPLRNLGVSFGGALLVASLYARSSRLKTVLGVAWFAHLGRLTYSIYMFHVIVLFGVKFALSRIGADQWYFVFLIGYPCSIAVAQLIYQTFEKPLIARGRTLASEWQLPAAAPKG